MSIEDEILALGKILNSGVLYCHNLVLSFPEVPYERYIEPQMQESLRQTGRVGMSISTSLVASIFKVAMYNTKYTFYLVGYSMTPYLNITFTFVKMQNKHVPNWTHFILG